MVDGSLLSDFWGYFEPIRHSMPTDCSADVQAVIAHVDCVLAADDSALITALKTTFGLQGFGHNVNDDFAAARTFATPSFPSITR